MPKQTAFERPRRASAWIGSAIVALSLASMPAGAQRRSPAEELVEQERIRTEVQKAFDLYYQDARDGGIKTDNMNVALDRLEALGDAAVPLLAEELERSLPHNFMFVALALGRIGTPEAREALLAAAEIADGETNEFAPIKRAWVGYSVAMLGDVEGVRLLSNGTHLAGQTPAHDETTIVEVAALYTAPDSLPVLYETFDRLLGQWEKRVELRELIATIAAMKLVATTDSVPRLLSALKSPDARVRREAADALQAVPTKEAVAGLMDILSNDGTPHVRYAAGWSIEQILPADQLDPVIELMATETDGNVRAVLYRIAVKLGGNAVLDRLRPYLGGPLMEDREGMMRALRLMDTPKTLPMLRAALNDPATRVLDQAVKGLNESSNPRARDVLIEAVNSPRWIVAFLAVRALAEADVERAAPVMAARLEKQELSRIISDPQVREHVYELGNALVALDYDEALRAIAEGGKRQRDGHLNLYLEELSTLLTAIKEHGDDVEKWGEALLSESESMRELAARRLAEIGTAEAAETLVATFRRVDMLTGRMLLRQIGAIDQPASRELIVRLLTDEAFDAFIRWPLREEAAYAAYRLGGADMEAALLKAWERRGGREGRLIVYLPALIGEDAIEPLERFRVSRMHYQKWTRGRELETLNWIVTELSAGRTVEIVARPPEAVDFRRPSWLPL